jgi:hypothetical protein
LPSFITSTLTSGSGDDSQCHLSSPYTNKNSPSHDLDITPINDSILTYLSTARLLDSPVPFGGNLQLTMELDENKYIQSMEFSLEL